MLSAKVIASSRPRLGSGLRAALDAVAPLALPPGRDVHAPLDTIALAPSTLLDVAAVFFTVVVAASVVPFVSGVLPDGTATGCLIPRNGMSFSLLAAGFNPRLFACVFACLGLTDGFFLMIGTGTGFLAMPFVRVSGAGTWFFPTVFLRMTGTGTGFFFVCVMDGRTFLGVIGGGFFFGAMGGACFVAVDGPQSLGFRSAATVVWCCAPMLTADADVPASCLHVEIVSGVALDVVSERG